MNKTLTLTIKRCRDCGYVSNSTMEHDCAFTSAPHPVTWWCTHPGNKGIDEGFIIDDVWSIDERCKL